MKHLLATALTLVLIGCASSGRDEDEVWQEIIKLKNKVEANENYAKAAVEQMLTQYRKMQERLAIVEGQVSTLTARVAGVESRVSSAAVRPAPGEAGSETPPDAKMLEKVELTLKALKAGQMDETAAIRELIPIAETSAPLVFAELRRNITDPKYSPVLEKILSTMPLETLRGPLSDAIKDERMRYPAARIIGTLKNMEFSKMLESYVAGATEDERLVLAEALAKCKNQTGLAPLVLLLRSERRDIRIIAIAALRNVNRGVDFNYRPLRTPGENEQSIQQWEEWLKTFADKVFEE